MGLVVYRFGLLVVIPLLVCVLILVVGGYCELLFPLFYNSFVCFDLLFCELLNGLFVLVVLFVCLDCFDTF